MWDIGGKRKAGISVDVQQKILELQDKLDGANQELATTINKKTDLLVKLNNLSSNHEKMAKDQQKLIEDLENKINKAQKLYETSLSTSDQYKISIGILNEKLLDQKNANNQLNSDLHVLNEKDNQNSFELDLFKQQVLQNKNELQYLEDKNYSLKKELRVAFGSLEKVRLDYENLKYEFNLKILELTEEKNILFNQCELFREEILSIQSSAGFEHSDLKLANENKNLLSRVEDLNAELVATKNEKKLLISNAGYSPPPIEKTYQANNSQDYVLIAKSLTEANNEISFLRSQLDQVRDELVYFSNQNQDVNRLYQSYKSRWDRIQKSLPEYFDVGLIEVVDFDNISDLPTLTWRINDCLYAGVEINDLTFKTCLFNGRPGIALLKKGTSDKLARDSYLVPQLIQTSEEALQAFLAIKYSAYSLIESVGKIFEKLIEVNWTGVVFPKNFDWTFWRPSINELSAQLKGLPPTLRYESVALKRELMNIDYEHIWIQIQKMTIGSFYWPKFELRLGASMMPEDGFSRFPKFEFPLIDGKTKPFDSWFQESADESGPKLEIRLALDKKTFDFAVWSKIHPLDRGLILRIINAFPNILVNLKEQKVIINRSLLTWIDFANESVELLKLLEVSKTVANNFVNKNSTEADSKKAPFNPLKEPVITAAVQKSSNQVLSSNRNTEINDKAAVHVISVSSRGATRKQAANHISGQSTSSRIKKIDR